MESCRVSLCADGCASEMATTGPTTNILEFARGGLLAGTAGMSSLPAWEVQKNRGRLMGRRRESVESNGVLTRDADRAECSNTSACLNIPIPTASCAANSISPSIPRFATMRMSSQESDVARCRSFLRISSKPSGSASKCHNRSRRPRLRLRNNTTCPSSRIISRRSRPSPIEAQPVHGGADKTGRGFAIFGGDVVIPACKHKSSEQVESRFRASALAV